MDDILVLTDVTEGQKARFARLAKKLRQIDGATIAKVNAMDITRLENDRYVLPVRKERILAALGISEDDTVPIGENRENEGSSQDSGQGHPVMATDGKRTHPGSGEADPAFAALLRVGAILSEIADGPEVTSEASEMKAATSGNQRGQPRWRR